MITALTRLDTGYQLLLFLHILCAIVGFGGVLLNALYGNEAKKRRGPGGLAISEANFFVTGIAQYFIYGVFLTGLLIIAVSEDPGEVGAEPWVATSVILYVIAVGISHAVVKPTAKRMIDLQQEMVAGGPPPADAPPGPPPQAAEMEALGKKMGIFGPILTVLFLVILYLMVFQPG